MSRPQPPDGNPVLRQALKCARAGWPVFPCHPGQKRPATPHGYLDATTDPAQLNAWFQHRPDLNLAVATGAPGPDILDADYRGPGADGFPALDRLHSAGLVSGAFAVIQTPNGGFHLYYTGSDQSSAQLPDHHLDFLAQGGYVLLPPSQVGGRRYDGINVASGHGTLDWDACLQVLDPARAAGRQARPQPPEQEAGEQREHEGGEPPDREAGA